LDSALASRDEIVSWLRLTLVPGVTPKAQRALLDVFKTAAGVAAASSRELAAVTDEQAARCFAAGPDPELLGCTLAWLQGEGRHLIAVNEPRYPQLLLQIHDPPSVLYAQGRIELLNTPALAIVGSRNATPQGARDAHAFAHAISEAGFAIVSGLALGIDAAAHRGGLSGAGSSIAVMGTGADRVYPRGNRQLAHALAAQGCIVTEFPLGTPSIAGNFPRRNRLISGLARGVLVVEAGIPSGSLNTAQHALEQGREVFAVPGSIHSPLSKGCHSLLKDGAKLVESAEDILVELGVARASGAKNGGGDEPERDPLLVAMGHGPVTLEQMAQRTGLAAAKLAAHLSRLEVAGRVQALAGGWFQRVATPAIE